jgi:hypothetical protein
MKKIMLWLMAGAMSLFAGYAFANYTLVQMEDGAFAIRNESTGINVLRFTRDIDTGKELVQILNSAGSPLQVVNRWCGQTYLADISAESTAYIVSEITGSIVSARVTIRGAITGTDSIVHFMVGTTNVAPTLTITQSGSAAGSTFTREGFSTTNAAVSRGDVIHIGTGGESSTTAIADISVCVNAW